MRLGYLCRMDESIGNIQLQSTQSVLETSEANILSAREKTKPSKETGKDKHLKKSCHVCLKTMRSDHLKRHVKTHNTNKTKDIMIPCNICTKIMRKDNLKRHLKTHKSIALDETLTPHSSKQDIISLLMHDHNQFNFKRKTGSIVKSTLLTHSIEPQSLRKEMKEALDIHEWYTTQETNTNLKGWQKEVLCLMETPTHREIIWVIGNVVMRARHGSKSILNNILVVEEYFELVLLKMQVPCYTCCQREL